MGNIKIISLQMGLNEQMLKSLKFSDGGPKVCMLELDFECP